MNEFLAGIATAGSWAVGLVLLRYWRETRDRFFAIFGVAFWVLSVNWIGLILAEPPNEARHYFYLTRLAAFVLIIVAIVDKNRASRS
jgi:drug/metabolite transporter (DMT)-like permease